VQCASGAKQRHSKVSFSPLGGGDFQLFIFPSFHLSIFWPQNSPPKLLDRTTQAKGASKHTEGAIFDWISAASSLGVFQQIRQLAPLPSAHSGLSAELLIIMCRADGGLSPGPLGVLKT